MDLFHSKAFGDCAGAIKFAEDFVVVVIMQSFEEMVLYLMTNCYEKLHLVKEKTSEKFLVTYHFRPFFVWHFVIECSVSHPQRLAALGRSLHGPGVPGGVLCSAR